MSIQGKKVALRRFADLVVVERRERKVKCYPKRLWSFGSIGSFETIEKPKLVVLVALTGIEPVFEP